MQLETKISQDWLILHSINIILKVPIYFTSFQNKYITNKLFKCEKLFIEYSLFIRLKGTVNIIWLVKHYKIGLVFKSHEKPFSMRIKLAEPSHWVYQGNNCPHSPEFSKFQSNLIHPPLPKKFSHIPYFPPYRMSYSDI